MAIFRQNEQLSRHAEATIGGKSPVPSVIQQTALIERKKYIENMFYPKSNPGDKPLTSEMEKTALGPIDECIHAPVNRVEEKKDNVKKFPTLEDWRTQKATNISFIHFKALVSQEHAHNPEIDEALLAEVFVIRSIEEARYLVESPEITSHIQKSMEITGQMKQYGIDATRQYYRTAHNIESVDSPKKLDLTRTEVLEDYPTIRQYELEQDEEKKKEIMLHADELSRNTLSRLRKKRDVFTTESAQENESHIIQGMEAYAAKLDTQIQEGYAYLDSLIPLDDRKLLDKSPYYIFKLANAMRKYFPVANTEVLAQIWWQLRLGGARAKDIYEHLKTEQPAFVKKNHLERYTKHLADNLLSSEAAGFEFQKNITIPEGETPNQLLYQTMRSLIQNHIPKNQEHVRFTIFDGENTYKKIIIPYHDGITDDEIYDSIDKAIEVSEWQNSNVSDREAAALSYKGHFAKERKADSTYQRIYGGFGKDESAGKDYEGDYLIQIGKTYKDSRDPRSLFAVDSHKVAVQLGFNEVGKVDATFRYNHTHFDGVSANVHTLQIIKEQNLYDIKREEDEIVSILPEKNNTIEAHLSGAIKSGEPEITSLPLLEARADYDDNEKYEGIMVGSEKGITRTEMRSLVIARANKLKYIQQLVLAKARGPYFERNINYNNIQPIVIAPAQLTQENKEEWMLGVRNAANRAKDGVGDVALFASILGTHETPLAMTGSFLNPTLTNMLGHSQGMFSALYSDGAFTTARSNAYRPAKIDLNNPEASVGVVGIALQDVTSHYTVRLSPAQAQEQLRNAVLGLCESHLSEERKSEILGEFTKIVKAWDDLGGGTGKYLSLEKYEKTRNKIFQSLVDSEDIQSDSVRSGAELQTYLNKALETAAQEVFNKTKMQQAHKELMELFSN